MTDTCDNCGMQTDRLFNGSCEGCYDLTEAEIAKAERAFQWQMGHWPRDE